MAGAAPSPAGNRSQLVLLPAGGVQSLESAFSLLLALQVMRSELQVTCMRPLHRTLSSASCHSASFCRCNSRCGAWQVEVEVEVEMEGERKFGVKEVVEVQVQVQVEEKHLMSFRWKNSCSELLS